LLTLQPWTRRKKLFRSEFAVLILVQLLEGFGGLGDFLGIDNSILVDVQGRDDGQNGSGLAGHSRAALRPGRITPLALHPRAARTASATTDAGTAWAFRAGRSAFGGWRPLTVGRRVTLVLGCEGPG
jgi:hypothetical protein